MGKLLRTVVIAGSVALAAGSSATGVLAQEDEAVTAGPAGTVSAEDLAEAILAEVMQGIALPASGGLEIDVPTVGGSGGNLMDGPVAGDINVGGSSGGEIMVGGNMGGGVSLGGGAMPAPTSGGDGSGGGMGTGGGGGAGTGGGGGSGSGSGSGY